MVAKRRRRRDGTKDKKAPVALRLPPEILKRARAAAAAEDRPLSVYLRRLIIAALPELT